MRTPLSPGLDGGKHQFVYSALSPRGPGGSLIYTTPAQLAVDRVIPPEPGSGGPCGAPPFFLFFLTTNTF